MVKLTQNLQKRIFDNHKAVISIMMGNLELFTTEMQEYLQWCKTEDGKKYLVGGSCYKEE